MNFVVGQASFTVFVVVLFNVLVPEGWRTGLVRVQDVAIGAGISVVVGALLWPRGARGVARREFADLLRSGGAHLHLALGAALAGGSVPDAQRAGVTAGDARRRATAALEDLALEHGGGRVDRSMWAAYLVDALVLRLASEGIMRARLDHGATGVCGDARASLAAEARTIVADVGREADRIEAGLARSGDARRRHAGATTEPGRVPRRAGARRRDRDLGLVWVHEWLALVGDRPRAVECADLTVRDGRTNAIRLRFVTRKAIRAQRGALRQQGHEAG